MLLLTFHYYFVAADSLLGSGSDEEEEDESRAANNSSSPAHAPHPALHSELSHNGDTKPHEDSEDQVGSGSEESLFSHDPFAYSPIRPSRGQQK